jgi:CheY-like chemotaxis protein
MLLLIVEDDHDTRISLAEFFGDEGYSVAEAADGRDGLSKLRSLRPALVLLDYAVPERRDGEEFLRSKAADPEVAAIPVIVMSGFQRLPKMDGVVAFLMKPFGTDEILALVHRFAGPPHKPDSQTAA